MLSLESRNGPSSDGIARTARRRFVQWAVLIAMALTLSVDTPAQTAQTPEVKLGRIIGTVTDINGNGVFNAKVVLSGSDPTDRRTLVTPESGFFEFDEVKPGIPYEITVSADGFTDWASSPVSLQPGEFKILTEIQLRIATQTTSVHVTSNSTEIATEQFKLQESQRILGFIPNMYVAYNANATPLTTKRKFQLALRVSIDPVTIAGVGLIAGVKQATDSPNYPQGAKGYGERFGAVAADGFTDIMIGGAILPSLLHQDPRYFYQGTGSAGSRVRHAIFSAFIAKGDNGKWQPNYSSLGGDLAASAISNAYYPASNRGAGLVFGNFAIGTAERIGANIAQEFILAKLTHRGGHAATKTGAAEIDHPSFDPASKKSQQPAE